MPDNKIVNNFTEKIKKVKNILNAWQNRDLTLIGKTTVSKSLVLPNPQNIYLKKYKQFSSIFSGIINQIKLKGIF